MYFGCLAWGHLWEKERATSAGSPLWQQAAALETKWWDLYFSPSSREKKKKYLSKPNLFVGNSSKTFPDSRKSALEKKKKSFQVFLMEGKTFGEVTAFCGKRLTKGKRLKCKEIFQMFPEQPFLVKQKHSSQAFPNFLLCSSVWERKCLEISVLLCRQERPRFLCAMPRAAGQQEHSGEAAGILCRQGRAAACRE